jgi:hypothetical protein
MRCTSIPQRSKYYMNVGGARVLFSNTNNPPSAGSFEEIIYLMLLANGATVTVIAGGNTLMSNNIADKDLFIISWNVANNTYSTVAQTTPVPGIVWRNGSYPIPMAGFSTTFGTNAGSAVVVLSPNHPLVTGEADSDVAVYPSSNTRNHASSPGAGAANICYGVGRSAGDSLVFCFEKGAAIDPTINGGVCSGRRVGIGLVGSIINERGIQFHVDAINWAMGGG